MATVPAADSTEEFSSYRWVVMGIWLTASVSGFMIMSTIGILLPAISEELQLSPFEQGMLGSAAYWGNFALAIPMGWWTSRFAPKALTTVTIGVGNAVSAGPSPRSRLCDPGAGADGFRGERDCPPAGPGFPDAAMVSGPTGSAGQQHLQRHVRPGGGRRSGGLVFHSDCAGRRLARHAAHVCCAFRGDDRSVGDLRQGTGDDRSTVNDWPPRMPVC